MTNTLLDDIHEMQAELASIRRDIHAHPEMAMEEVRTSSLIAEKLKEWGLTVTEGIGRYGVVGTLKSSKEGVISIGLRADMDALQLTEKTNVPYASTKVGVMHACGHDGHIVMLLGAAKYLAEHRESFCGTVYFIFQPAEEKLDGALAMIKDHLFDRFPMNTIYGLHNTPSDRLGQFSIRSGPMMAATDSWYVTFHGTGGHGGAGAHLATDVTVLHAQFILALQTIISRNVNSLESGVISVGAIESGSFGSVNVMPDTIRIGGTARSLTTSVRDTIERRMRELANGLAVSFGCTAEVEYIRDGTPLVNHEENTKRAIAAAQTIVGEANVDQNRQPTMGGEDFAWMLLQRPGAFIFLGVNDDETKRSQLHSPTYNFNDKGIPFGVAYWAALVQQELKN